jgi:hypothetical protein
MDDNTEMIGTFAGKIWENLSENESLSPRQLMRNTQLKNNEFYMGIGWLAKEDKINKSEEDNRYYLGETNLSEEIGKRAGEVWNALKDQSKKNVAAIAKSTNLRPKEVYAALGWLAREDKLVIFDDKTLQKKYGLKR